MCRGLKGVWVRGLKKYVTTHVQRVKRNMLLHFIFDAPRKTQAQQTPKPRATWTYQEPTYEDPKDPKGTFVTGKYPGAPFRVRVRVAAGMVGVLWVTAAELLVVVPVSTRKGWEGCHLRLGGIVDYRKVPRISSHPLHPHRKKKSRF